MNNIEYPLIGFVFFQDAHPSVEIFILDHNRIKRIESYLGAYVRLTTLSIKNNDISSIAVGSFASTPLLRDLDLSKNKLSQITRTTFSGLKLLQVNQLSFKKSKSFVFHQIK